jgi:uncharacterized protein (DUF58 family)
VRTRATDRFVVAVCATAAGALVAILAGRPDAAVLAAPWLVLLVVGLRPRPPTAPTASVATSSRRLVTGDPVEIDVTLDGIDGTVEVQLLPSTGFWAADATVTDMKAAHRLAVCRGSAHVPLSLPSGVWGTHDLGAVQVDVTARYGLFRHAAQFRTAVPIRVHPTPAQLQALLQPWLVRRAYGVHRSNEASRGIEYADLRPFTAGDSPRDINWRMSARSQKLWIAQRHPERATDVILLLDSFVESGHDVQTVVGLAIQAAITLAESHLAMLDRVGLVELGGVVRWASPGTGALHLQRLTDELLATKLYSTAAERTLDIVPPRALPPRSFILALSPLLDERFINVVGQLGGRGHDVAVVECAVAEDAHVPIEPQEPDDDDQRATHLQATVAKRIWEAEREMVRDQLTRQGVAVAPWSRGSDLDPVIDLLTRRRVQVRTRAVR